VNTIPSNVPTIGRTVVKHHFVEPPKIGHELLNLRNSLIVGQSFHSLEIQTNKDTAYDGGWNARSLRTDDGGKNLRLQNGRARKQSRGENSKVKRV